MSKALQVIQVQELVHMNRGKAFADSLSVAKNFGKRHDHVLRDIENLKKDLPNFGEMFRESKYLDDYGREQKMIETNRDGFTLLAMGFTGKKALEWKLKYIEAFNTMEQMVLQKQNHEWLTVRKQGKAERVELGCIVKDFIDYCKTQGSQNADRYYGNITTATYKALELIKGKEKVPSQFRDTLSTFDLSSLVMAERVVQGAIAEGMIKRMFYKDIYQYAKERVLSFASSIAIAKLSF